MQIQTLVITLTSCCLAMLAPRAVAQGTPGSGGGAGPGANIVHYGSAGEEGGQGQRFGGPLEGGNLAMQPGQNQIMFRASRLIGMNAASPQGQELGKVNEIVFHPEIGILAVVATPTGRVVPIPWQLVSAITGRTLVFNTTLQALNAAPTVTGGEWANFNSPVFTHEIFAYFGVPPHAPMVAGAFGGRAGWSGNAGYGGGAGYGQGGFGGGATTGSQENFGEGNQAGYGNAPGYGGQGGNGGSYGNRGGYGNQSGTTGAGYGGTGAGAGGQSYGRGSSQAQQGGNQRQQSGNNGQQSGSQNSSSGNGNQSGNSQGGQR